MTTTTNADWLPAPPKLVQCPELRNEPGRLCRYVEAHPVFGTYEYHCGHCRGGHHFIAPAEVLRLHEIAEMHAREAGER
jgi:hypothetical protein